MQVSNSSPGSVHVQQEDKYIDNLYKSRSYFSNDPPY